MLARSEEQLVRRFGHLPPLPVAQGRRWLRHALQAVRVARYLSGDPAYDLPAGDQAAAVTLLAAGPARWAALRLLRAADDEQLRQIFAGGPRLVRLLEEALVADPVLRGELDAFLEARFEAGRDAVAAGEVRPYGLPAGLFTPELISAELAGVAAGDELTAGQYELARAAIRGAPRQ